MHNCIFRCAMKAPRPPIPEIRARTPQPGVSSIHLLRSQVEHDLPTFNSGLHRDFSLYPLAVLLSEASNLLLRQSKNCPVSFSAVPCSRRAPTLAIVPLKCCLYSPYTNSNHCLPVFIFQHLQALKTGRTGSYLIDVVEKRPYLLNGSGNSLRTSKFHTEPYLSY